MSESEVVAGQEPPGPAARVRRSPRRWKASLDAPGPDSALEWGRNLVGGWALHGWRRVLGVLVTVDGRPNTLITEFHERADVAERWPDYPHRARAGWTGTFDLSDHLGGDEVVAAAYGLLEPGEADADLGPGSGFGPVRHIGTARVRLRSADVPFGLRAGRFHEVPSLSPGHVRVFGEVHLENEVATVEVLLDGRSVGLARVTPTVSGTTRDLAMIRTARFEHVIEVPAGAASCIVSAVATDLSGRRFEVLPWAVDVVAREQPPRPTAARMAVVRERTRSRTAAVTGPGRGARVLVVTHDLGLGGGQLYLHELLLRLHRRGLEVVVASLRGGALTDDLEALGIPVHVTGPTQVQDPEAYEARVFDIAALAAEHGCGAALANTMNAFPGVDAAVRLGLPVTWAIHESYPLGQFWMEMFGPEPAHDHVVERARACLGAASRVVFEAHPTLELYRPWLAPEAGVVVPYGVDLARIEATRAGVDRAALRAELGIAPTTRALLCMGTIEPRKGQQNLAQAFAGSPVVARADTELILVGAVEGVPYAEELRALVETLGSTRIRVEAMQSDVDRWYHACDVLVCASDVESLPRSMLEAMAFGRPVASTAVFGIPDLVEDGVSGFLCPDRDLAALRRMLERVVETDGHDLAAMGERARRVVTTRHDPAVYEEYFASQLSSTLGAAEGRS